MSKKLFIGIDPDTQKSGVAIWENKKLTLLNLSFFELLERIKTIALGANVLGLDIVIVIEAGWLNKKSNWHGHGFGEGVASRTGAKVGANHETGKKIVEMCEYLNMTYELVRPESKKVNAKFFKQLTKYEGRTNQETRDAAMLVFGK